MSNSHGGATVSASQLRMAIQPPKIVCALEITSDLFQPFDTALERACVCNREAIGGVRIINEYLERLDVRGENISSLPKRIDAGLKGS